MDVNVNAVLTDLCDRIEDSIRQVTDGLSQETAEWSPGRGANTICWLVWHTGRCIDFQLHELDGGPELWHQEWKQRLQIPVDDGDLGMGEMGYGQDPVDAARVVAPIAELQAYALACCAELREHCAQVEADRLQRIVDERHDPPVTAGVRLISILVDCQEHLGAALYLKGLHA